MFFYSPKKEIFGIDLSDLSVKIAKIERKGKLLTLTSLGKKSLPEGLIEKGIINEEKEEGLVKIIKSAILEVKGKKIKTKYAVCSLPEENSFIKAIKIQKAEESEIEELVKWQIEPNFPAKLSEVYFDWQKVNPQKELIKDGTLLLSVAVAPRVIVDSYLSIFKKAGIEPLAFDVESMATVRSIIPNSYSSHPVIILDMGRTGTCLTVFSGGVILFTSHINIAGLDFDKAIAKELKVGPKDAEKFKKEIGLSGIEKKWKTYHIPVIGKKDETKGKSPKIDLLLAMKEEKNMNALIPLLTDLVKRVQHYIEYFKEFGKIDFIPDGRIAEIILCGGEANLIGLPEFFSDSFHIPVKLGNPLINISFASRIFDEKFKKEASAYSTAIGLAMRNIQ